MHGTCRDPSRTDAVAHLTVLPGAAERLKLFKADLLAPGSFEEPVKGCDYVIHTASPFVLKVKDPIKQLIEPAINGTANVLDAVNKAPSVKRVVLTSCECAPRSLQRCSCLHHQSEYTSRRSDSAMPPSVSPVCAPKPAPPFTAAPTSAAPATSSARRSGPPRPRPPCCPTPTREYGA